MIQNKLRWDASQYTVRLSKQRKVGLDWYESFVLEVTVGNLHNLFRTMCPDPAKGLLFLYFSQD